MFKIFRILGEHFFALVTRKKKYLFFQDIAHFFLTFSKIGHRGYVLGPKNLFSSMLVLCALIKCLFLRIINVFSVTLLAALFLYVEMLTIIFGGGYNHMYKCCREFEFIPDKNVNINIRVKIY